MPSSEICLINPPLISQRNDPHTGIIFMPFMLAALSAYLRQRGWKVQVLDAFGLAPSRFAPYGRKQIQGLSILETVQQIHSSAQVIILHFGGVVAYRAIVELLGECRRRYPGKKYVLMENAQAVTSLSLRAKAEEFLDLGFDALLHGDPEVAVNDLLVALSEGGPLPERAGLIFRRPDGSVFMSPKQEFFGNLDSLPFPDWTSFPLENYWSIGYAHGPMEGPYLPLLTSRWMSRSMPVLRYSWKQRAALARPKPDSCRRRNGALATDHERVGVSH